MPGKSDNIFQSISLYQLHTARSPSVMSIMWNVKVNILISLGQPMRSPESYSGGDMTFYRQVGFFVLFFNCASSEKQP